MKQNIFSKKNQLDEMQEQTLRKIESRGFWLMWWGLFAVIIFQLMMQADISQMAGEWIVFMAACLYTLEECCAMAFGTATSRPALAPALWAAWSVVCFSQRS